MTISYTPPPMPIRTLLLFGGRSAEHEVSILSARSVAKAATKERVDIVPVCIARDGRFVAPERSARILNDRDKTDTGDDDFSMDSWLRTAAIDCVFPLIHGTGGEDGTLQGYLEMLGLPYAGSGVTASAIGMDKGHMKHAFAAAKLPLVEFVQVHEHDWHNERERILRAVNNALRLPYFVKPANGGSSVGVTKVKNDQDLGAAIEKAFRFDENALVESGSAAREIGVAGLGNAAPQARVPGEIIAGREFADYEAMTVDDKTQPLIPAALTKEKIEEFRRLAIAAFKAI